MTHRIKDGWKLYYSEEGYPYYFNELTGESEWADTKEVDGFQQSQQQHSQENYSDPEGNGGDEEEDEDSESRSNQLNDEESGASDTSSTFDEAFNEKFKAFLRTPEGIEAVIAEQERIAKYVEKKTSKLEEEREKEYARTLMINKKDDDNPNRGAVAGMWDAFGKFLGIKEPPSPRKNKSTKDSLERGTREKFDDYGREAKHRNRAGRQPVEKADGDIEGGSSPAISRESSSSELESLSSEDSDVAVINAPLFSELPPWMRPNALYERLVLPFHDFLQRQGIIASTATVGEYIRSRGYSLLGNLGEQSLVLAQQGASIVGTTLVQLTALTWQNVQPYIVHFMETVIDSPIGGAGRIASQTTANDAPAADTTSPSDVNLEAGTLEASDGEGWKYLPPSKDEMIVPPRPQPPVARVALQPKVDTATRASGTNATTAGHAGGEAQEVVVAPPVVDQVAPASAASATNTEEEVQEVVPVVDQVAPAGAASATNTEEEVQDSVVEDSPEGIDNHSSQSELDVRMLNSFEPVCPNPSNAEAILPPTPPASPPSMPPIAAQEE